MTCCICARTNTVSALPAVTLLSTGRWARGQLSYTKSQRLEYLPEHRFCKSKFDDIQPRGIRTGSISSATFSIPTANWLPRDNIQGTYLQDDWKVRPNLTLNLGVRWNIESPFHTKYGQFSQFSATAQDNVATGDFGKSPIRAATSLTANGRLPSRASVSHTIRLTSSWFGPVSA